MAYPPEIVGLQQKAATLLRAGRKRAAIDAYVALLRAQPALPESWFNLAWLQREERQFEEAASSYAEAVRRGVSKPEEALVNKAAILSAHLGRFEEARSDLESALKLAPGYLPALLNLGNIHEDLGDREAAKTSYMSALSTSPSNALALARLAHLTRIDSPTDPIVDRIHRALAVPGLTSQERSDLGFGLGRLLDSCGAFDAAFSAYTDANKAASSAFGRWGVYDRAASEAMIDSVIEATPLPATMSDDTTYLGAPPIFICGMFRSGSTLAETLLGNHPALRSGGELDILPAAVAREWPDFPLGDAELTTLRVNTIRDSYLAELGRRFGRHTLITDKRPDNFLYVGLIKAMFPSARIVNTVRNPCDNALSIFFQPLGPQFGYATNLSDISHWYGQYRRLSSHWRELFGTSYHDFDYDGLVAEPAQQVGALLDFLDLPFDERCLAPNGANRAVQTGSVWQVRRPLYQESSGRWRNYARHLMAVSADLGC